MKVLGDVNENLNEYSVENGNGALLLPLTFPWLFILCRKKIGIPFPLNKYKLKAPYTPTLFFLIFLSLSVIYFIY